jgi:hypothetical protein
VHKNIPDIGFSEKVFYFYIVSKGFSGREAFILFSNMA